MRLHVILLQLLLLLHLFARLTTAQFALPPGSCNRASGNVSAEPTFICRYEVFVHRNADCSLSIREDVTLPHMYPETYNWSFWIGSLQDVLANKLIVNDVLETNNAINRSMFGGDICGQGIFIAGFFKNPTPTKLSMRYTVVDGVMRYTGHLCDTFQHVTDDRFQPSNMVRWTTGRNKIRDYDFVNVSFTTDVPGATLVMLNSSSDTSHRYAATQAVTKGKAVWRSFEQYKDVGAPVENENEEQVNVKGVELQMFVVESGSPPCNQSAWCVRRVERQSGDRYTLAFFVVLVIFLLTCVVLLAICVCAPCGSGKPRSKSKRNKAANHDD